MNPRILVVDDDEMIRLLYSKELADDGYEVETADCGTEALNKTSSASYNCIVLDIEMPDVQGLEVLKHIRDTTPETPVIINSAYAIYKTDFNSWLADEYIVKSSDLKPLKKKIRELINGAE
jgi:DNA-binding response OmpR family regulator